MLPPVPGAPVPWKQCYFQQSRKKNCGRFGRALFFWGFMFGFKLGAVQHAFTRSVYTQVRDDLVWRWDIADLIRSYYIANC